MTGSPHMATSDDWSDVVLIRLDESICGIARGVIVAGSGAVAASGLGSTGTSIASAVRHG